jgi:hypothetical protein
MSYFGTQSIGPPQCWDRDVGKHTAMGHGRAHEEPNGDAEGTNRRYATSCFMVLYINFYVFKRN